MSEHTPAVVLLGGLDTAANRRYLRAAATRGLAVLVVDDPGTRLEDLVERWRGDAGTGATPAEIARCPTGHGTEITDQAATWSGRYSLRGVCPLREEYVDVAALVADLFDLPSPGLRAARVCSDAYLRRRYLAAWTPRYESVAPAQRAEIAAGWTRFPVAVTPGGRAANPGARLVRDAAELSAALAAYPRNQRLTLEEQAVGQEYTINSLSVRSQVRHLEVIEQVQHDSADRVPTRQAEATSGLAAEDRRCLSDTHLAILAHLEFGTGITRARYHRIPGRAPALTSIAAHAGGDSAPAGDGYEDAVIGLSVGEEIARL